jgi:predicted unusual protein kinase regulating ubiquinone biosynthesis (AarF/ABC1/UbiB family)
VSVSIAELLAALPEPQVESADYRDLLPLEAWSKRPVPVGRFRRLRLLGSLPAKIAAAYVFCWLRGWFADAQERARLSAETHWRTAVSLLDSMSYLRGAVIKAGQTLANFPDVAPRELVETLDCLHYDAPPMHWSLLCEFVANELGDDADRLFASLDKRPFAAASLGQVHRAQLKTGEDVAVKIQYPGIARAIRDDLRNLAVLMLPGRLSRDWNNIKAQFDDLRDRLEQETDYEHEAGLIEEVRRLFREHDGIAIPRVFRQFSTARVLTMDRLEGIQLDQFMARNPSQIERNEFACKILRAWYRMLYAGRLLYADFHPGNFLHLNDGRLGVVDFGFVMRLNDEEWELFRLIDRPLTTGRREDRIAAIKEWSSIADDDAEFLRLGEQFADWCWRSRYYGRAFDFSDEVDFRTGVELFGQMVKKRYTRGRACTPVVTRCQFGLRSTLYRLKARIDVAKIAEEEIKAAGWNRSDYAQRA